MDWPARDESPYTFVAEATGTTKYRRERGVRRSVTARDHGHWEFDIEYLMLARTRTRAFRTALRFPTNSTCEHWFYFKIS